MHPIPAHASLCRLTPGGVGGLLFSDGRVSHGPFFRTNPRLTEVDVKRQLLPTRIEPVRSPQRADENTLRLCTSERDAFLASVTLSGLTYEEIAARIGITKQAVHKWGREGVPHNRVRAFCNATGTLLLDEYLRLDRLMRQAIGRSREADRITAIAEAARRVA